MNTIIKTSLAASILGLAAALPSAQAQLSSHGLSRGEFADSGLPFTSVINGTDASLFQSGVPSQPSHTQTSIEFTGDTFGEVSDGGRLELGNVVIGNGRTLGGSTASWASMDLYLNLPEEGVVDFKLTTLTFSIDNTENIDGLVPDVYLVSIGKSNTLAVGDQRIAFDVQLTNPAFALGTGVSISESQSASFGLFANLDFTPVPEPSTYALCGAALLVGLIALRRYRSAQTTAA